MGGNVTATVKLTCETTRAQKIPLDKIGRIDFVSRIREMFIELNRLFFEKYEKTLINLPDLLSGYIFNGSSSYVMDYHVTDRDILKYKKTIGDIDIIVPNFFKEEVWELLDSLEDKEFLPGITYKGSNKLTKSSIGDQINGVFLVNFKNYTYAAQVDFEFLPFDSGRPTEWSKFSHSSSIEDAKIGVKAVFHKYLLRALTSSVSEMHDVVIVTPASTAEKFKTKKLKEFEIPRMLKFSVTRGLRIAYEHIAVETSGKQVYREIHTKDSNFITDVSPMFSIIFSKKPKKLDLERFESFKGLTILINRKMTNKIKERILFRFTQLLWDSKMGQALEVDNPELDFEIKMTAYRYLLDKLQFELDIMTMAMIDKYYCNYGNRGKYEPNFWSIL